MDIGSSRPRRRPGRPMAALLVLVSAALLPGCGTYAPADARADYDFVLQDMDGAAVRLSDFRGRPLVINFWATWCVPCQREMPQLVALAERYRPRGVAIVGITTDDGPEETKAFAARYGVTYPLLLGRDVPAAAEAFGYTGLLPMTIFVSADGRITGRLIGTATDDFFIRRLERLIGGAGP